jgi:hypothetical protein
MYIAIVLTSSETEAVEAGDSLVENEVNALRARIATYFLSERCFNGSPVLGKDEEGILYDVCI